MQLKNLLKIIKLIYHKCNQMVKQNHLYKQIVYIQFKIHLLLIKKIIIVKLNLDNKIQIVNQEQDKDKKN